jgi:hypothetical protein
MPTITFKNASKDRSIKEILVPPADKPECFAPMLAPGVSTQMERPIAKDPVPMTVVFDDDSRLDQEIEIGKDDLDVDLAWKAPEKETAPRKRHLSLMGDKKRSAPRRRKASARGKTRRRHVA